MAELETVEAKTTSCCSPAAQETCCEPEAKAECCGEGRHRTGCGCSPTAAISTEDIREVVRERYAAGDGDGDRGGHGVGIVLR